jgi:hypothetical protein
MNHEVLDQRSSEWILIDTNDNGYLSPDEDGEIIEGNDILLKPNLSFGDLDNDIQTKILNTDDDELVNNILEAEFILKNDEIFEALTEKENILDSKTLITNKSISSNDDSSYHSIINNENIPLKNTTINITKEIVKKIPKSVWINIALHLLKKTSSSYDWRIALTYSLASTTILIIRNRTIILNLTKFTILNGIPFIIDKTTCLKSYYFKKD